MSLSGNVQPDCPHWKEPDKCWHDPAHVTTCSLPSHVPYQQCALKPDEKRPVGQGGKGCLVLIGLLFSLAGAALCAVFILMR